MCFLSVFDTSLLQLAFHGLVELPGTDRFPTNFGQTRSPAQWPFRPQFLHVEFIFACSTCSRRFLISNSDFGRQLCTTFSTCTPCRRACSRPKESGTFCVNALRNVFAHVLIAERTVSCHECTHNVLFHAIHHVTELSIRTA